MPTGLGQNRWHLVLFCSFFGDFLFSLLFCYTIIVLLVVFSFITLSYLDFHIVHLIIILFLKKKEKGWHLH